MRFSKRILILIFGLFICSSAFAGVTFDGTDDRIAVGAGALNSDVSYTIFLVFKEGLAATEQSVYSERGSGGGTWIEVQFRGDQTDKIVYKHYTASGSGDLQLYGTGPWGNQLLRVVAISRSATDHELFCNGTSQGTSSLSVGNLTPASAYIGSDSANHYFKGTISEVAVWNVALTAQEIQIISNSLVKGIARQIQPTALVRYWLLDEQPDGTSFDGDTAEDQTGNQDGTGSDGANNTGLAATAEPFLSYP